MTKKTRDKDSQGEHYLGRARSPTNRNWGGVGAQQGKKTKRASSPGGYFLSRGMGGGGGGKEAERERGYTQAHTGRKGSMRTQKKAGVTVQTGRACGGDLTRDLKKRLSAKGRVMDMVSEGGAVMVGEG